jgi:hypothetical protein
MLLSVVETRTRKVRIKPKIAREKARRRAQAILGAVAAYFLWAFGPWRARRSPP